LKGRKLNLGGLPAKTRYTPSRSLKKTLHMKDTSKIKEQFPLLYLKHLQEDLIEHKWPTEDGNVSYFIEAAGDIYRELCKEHVDRAYIAEKERKLKNFFTLTSGDINELIEVRKRHPDYPSKLNRFLEKVCELEKITKDFHFGMYADRKKKMLGSLSVIKSIVKWGKGEIDRYSVEAVISDFLSEEV